MPSRLSRCPEDEKGPDPRSTTCSRASSLPCRSSSDTARRPSGPDSKGIWTSDHFQPWQPNEGHSGSAWVTLAALTQRTSRISLGTGVTCPSFRYRPAVVAQVWASLSQLAPGRVFLGVGAGENLNEGAAGGGWGLISRARISTSRSREDHPRPLDGENPCESRADSGTWTPGYTIRPSPPFPSTWPPAGRSPRV